MRYQLPTSNLDLASIQSVQILILCRFLRHRVFKDFALVFMSIQKQLFLDVSTRMHRTTHNGGVSAISTVARRLETMFKCYSCHMVQLF